MYLSNSTNQTTIKITDSAMIPRNLFCKALFSIHLET